MEYQFAYNICAHLSNAWIYVICVYVYIKCTSILNDRTSVQEEKTTLQLLNFVKTTKIVRKATFIMRRCDYFFLLAIISTITWIYSGPNYLNFIDRITQSQTFPVIIRIFFWQSDYLVVDNTNQRKITSRLHLRTYTNHGSITWQLTYYKTFVTYIKRFIKWNLVC